MGGDTARGEGTDRPDPEQSAGERELGSAEKSSSLYTGRRRQPDCFVAALLALTAARSGASGRSFRPASEVIVDAAFMPRARLPGKLPPVGRGRRGGGARPRPRPWRSGPG